jgi:hypothetical protein
MVRRVVLMRLLFIRHRTTIMRFAAQGHMRDERVERVKRVKRRDAAIADDTADVPVGGAVATRDGWWRNRRA